MQKACEEVLNGTNLQVFLSQRERDAFDRLVRDTGMKKYRIVRDAIIKKLVSEGYLQEQNSN